MLKNVNKSKIILIIVILLAAIAIPLTVFQGQKKQEIRQRASGPEQNVSIENVAANTKAVKVGDVFTADIYLSNPQLKNISAIDITINYGEELQLVNYEALTRQYFYSIKEETKTQGVIHFAGVNFDPDTKSTYPSFQFSKLRVGIITFKAVRTGKTTVTLKNNAIKITAAKSGNIFNPSNNNLLGEYTIQGETPQTSPPPQSAKGYTISGTVFVNSDGKRIPFNPTVNDTAMLVGPLYAEKSGAVDVMAIANDGKYLFENVPSGIYALFFRMPNGFRPVQSGGNVIGVTLNSDKTVDFDMMPSPQGITPTLTEEDKNRQNQLIVKYHTVFADCFDSNHPVMTDSLSIYNSAACKAHPERQHLDINHDGKVDAVDLNIFIRSMK